MSRKGSKTRKGRIKAHRLHVFERTFDEYLEGKTTAEYLEERARKLKEVRK